MRPWVRWEAATGAGTGTSATVDAVLAAPTDGELLRRFEPVLRLTRGELFLPGAIEDYLQQAALVKEAGKAEQVLAKAGTLTPAGLATLGRQHRDEALSLRYVAEAMDSRQYRAWRRDGPAPSVPRARLPPPA